MGRGYSIREYIMYDLIKSFNTLTKSLVRKTDKIIYMA